MSGKPQTRSSWHRAFGMPVDDEYDWPEAGDYLWTLFWEMGQDRQDGPNGPQPLGPVFIRAWCDLTGRRLSPDEVAIIRKMDAAYLHSRAVEAAVGVKAGSGGKG